MRSSSRCRRRHHPGGASVFNSDTGTVSVSDTDTEHAAIKTQAQRPLARAMHYILPMTMMMMMILPVRCLLQSDSSSLSSSSSSQSTDRQQQAAAALTGQTGFGGGAPSSLSLADGGMLLMNGYLNNKRARKMSAFMPMRGRKDGRDSTSNYYGNGATTDWLLVAPPMHESQDADQDNILRLLANQQQQQQASALIGGTPRSFVDQIAARRAQMVQQQQQQQQQPVQQQQQQSQTRAGGEVVFEPNGLNLVVADPSALELAAGGSQSAVMQAKLRRAFHPMRGKKRFDPELISSSELLADKADQLGAEYAEM